MGKIHGARDRDNLERIRHLEQQLDREKKRARFDYSASRYIREYSIDVTCFSYEENLPEEVRSDLDTMYMAIVDAIEQVGKKYGLAIIDKKEDCYEAVESYEIEISVLSQSPDS